MSNKYLRNININIKNKAKRVPIAMCIDVSDSMNLIVDGFDQVRNTGRTVFTDQREYEVVEGGISLMDKVHDGIETFYKAVLDDDMAADSCESSIITFSDTAKVYDGFAPVDAKERPDFSDLVGGNTNVTPAIRMALDLLEKQKQIYKDNKIPYNQPWLVLFTDGLPTDDVSAIKRELIQMQNDGKLSVYVMALSDDPELLRALSGFSTKPPISCRDYKEIQRFFDFLAKSVSVIVDGGIPSDFF
jgi:uncharacterized protein YegL